MHQKDKDIKCLIQAKSQKQSHAAGVRSTSLLPSLPACCLPVLLSLPRACPGLSAPGEPHGLVHDLAGGIQAGSCPGDPTYKGMTRKGMTSLLGRGHDYLNVVYGCSVSGGSWLLFLDLWLHISKKTPPKLCGCVNTALNGGYPLQTLGGFFLSLLLGNCELFTLAQ